MNTDIQVVSGDYGYIINFSLVNVDGSIFNLTNATGVLLKVQKRNQTQISFSGSMTINSATAGTCYYQVALGNFSSAGYYNAQIQVVFAGEIVTFPNVQILAIAKLPS